MIALLRSANASEQTIKLAKGLSCPACQTKVSPSTPAIARLKRTWEFNQQVMVDTLEVSVIGRTLKLLNIVDEVMKLRVQVVALLWSGCTAGNVRSGYR